MRPRSERPTNGTPAVGVPSDFQAYTSPFLAAATISTSALASKVRERGRADPFHARDGDEWRDGIRIGVGVDFLVSGFVEHEQARVVAERDDLRAAREVEVHDRRRLVVRRRRPAHARFVVRDVATDRRRAFGIPAATASRSTMPVSAPALVRDAGFASGPKRALLRSPVRYESK